MKYPCSLCLKPVKTNCIQCDFCNLWVHAKCANLTISQLQVLSASNEKWYCNRCYKEAFPFHDLDDEEFIMFNLDIRVSDLDLYVNCNHLNKLFLDQNYFSDENCDRVNFGKSKYYTEEEFKLKFTVNGTDTKSDNLNILHINCRSLKSNYEAICMLLYNLKFKFDIIAMSETWLSEKENLDFYNLKGYKIYKCNRINKRGGVLLFVSELYDCTLLHDVTYAIDDILEVVTIMVKLKSKNITVACMYRAPNTNLVKFNQIFCEYMEAVKNKTFYLCGDFNINLINYEQNQETNIFMNNLFTYGMYPLINRPSRITKTSATLIDNIFSNDIKTCVTSGLLISDISDPLPVFCCYNNSLSCHNTETVKGNQEIRLVNDRNLYNLNLSLAECFETLYQSDDVNEAYTIF